MLHKFESMLRDSKKATSVFKDTKKAIPIDEKAFRKEGVFSREFIAATEASIFLFFLSPHTESRVAAIQALESIKNLQKYSSSPAASTEISLWSILDGCGTSVLNSCSLSLDRFQIPTGTSCSQPLEKTVLEFVSSDPTQLKSKRLMLAVFAEVGRAMSREAPLTAQRVCNTIITTRLPKVTPNFSAQQQGVPQTPRTHELWWGSYVAFCFAALVPARAPGEEKSPEYDALIQYALPCARHYCEHNRPQGKDLELAPIDMFSLAVERCNVAALEHLFRSLEPLFADITLGASTSKAVKERTQNMLVSMVAYIARHAPAGGTLVQSSYLAHFFVRFVENELEFFSDPANEFIWDTYTYSRHHLCVFLEHFFKCCNSPAMAVTGTGLSAKTRLGLFDLLSAWAAVDVRFKEESVQKRITAEIEAASKGLPKRKEHITKSILDYNAYLCYAATAAIAALGLGLTDDPSTNSRMLAWAEALILRTLRAKRKEWAKPRRACELAKANAMEVLKSFLLNTQNEGVRAACIAGYIEKCYSLTQAMSEAYFGVLTDVAVRPEGGKLLIAVENALATYLHLGLYMSLSGNQQIRRKTMRLIEFVYAQTVETFPPMSFGCDSALDVTYGLSTSAMSRTLAKCFAPEAYSVTTECAKHVAEVSDPEGMLEYLLPWVERMDFSVMTPIKSEALCNLVYITHLFKDDHRHQVMSFWTALAKKPYNIASVISRLLDLSTAKNSNDFANVTKTICLYLVSESPKVTVDRLVGELIYVICETKEIPFPESDAVSNEKLFSSQQQQSSSSSPSSLSSSFTTTSSSSVGGCQSSQLLDSVLPNMCSYSSFSHSSFLLDVLSEISYCKYIIMITGVFSCRVILIVYSCACVCVYLFVIILASGEHFKAHLPALLHIIFLGFDYPALSIYESCRVLLLNLVRCIVIRYFVKIGLRRDDSEEFAAALSLCEYLDSQERDAFWDEPPTEALDGRAVTLIMRVIQVFSLNREYCCQDPEVPTAVSPSSTASSCGGGGSSSGNGVNKGSDLRKKWAEEAHMWAVGCPQVVQAIRSCQIYRVLATDFTMEQVQTLLERTAPLLASDDIKEIRLASEGLRALEHIARLMTREQLLCEYRDFFWAACATLYSDCEEHFTLSVKLIGALLEKLPDIGDPKVFALLCSSSSSPTRSGRRRTSSVGGAGGGRSNSSSSTSRNRGVSFRDYESLVLYGFICSTAQDDIANVLSTLLSAQHDGEDELTMFSAALIVLTLWLSENSVKCPRSRRSLVKEVASRFYAALAAHGAENAEQSYARLVGWKYTARRDFITDIERAIVSIVCSNPETATCALALLLGIADTPVCGKYLDVAMHIASKIVDSAPPGFMQEFPTPAKASCVFGPLATMIADKHPPEYPQAAPWRDLAIDMVFWVIKNSPLSAVRTKDFDHETWRLSACSSSGSFHVFSKLPAAGGLKAKSALDEVTERMSEKFSPPEAFRSSLAGRRPSSPVSASSLSASDTCSSSSSSSSASSSSSSRFKPLHERSS